MTWTDQKIQMLRDMWGHGYSASEIAAKLGGMTRNAVIGKAHRLKLSVRSDLSKSSPDAQAALGGSVLSSVKSSSRKRVMLRPLPVMPAPETVRTYAPQMPASVEAVRRNSEGVAVTKAGDRHCRWPVGDPRSPDFRFCGCTAHEGLPYCIDHARVAYQSIGRRQRNSAQTTHMDTRQEFHGTA